MAGKDDTGMRIAGKKKDRHIVVEKYILTRHLDDAYSDGDYTAMNLSANTRSEAMEEALVLLGFELRQEPHPDDSESERFVLVRPEDTGEEVPLDAGEYGMAQAEALEYLGWEVERRTQVVDLEDKGEIGRRK